MLKRTGLLGLVSTLALAGAAAAQTPVVPSGTAPMPAGAATFVTDQPLGQFRASKFVGLDVYGPDNQRVGDINEILIDPSGTARGVVIGVGGFLGIGEKNVAVPFDALLWSNVRPVVATGSVGAVVNPPPAAMPGAVTVDPNAGTTARPMRSPDETAAFEGRPDHAVTTLTKADLQNAPAFRYYADTHPAMGATMPGVTPPTATPAMPATPVRP